MHVSRCAQNFAWYLVPGEPGAFRCGGGSHHCTVAAYRSGSAKPGTPSFKEFLANWGCDDLEAVVADEALWGAASDSTDAREYEAEDPPNCRAPTKSWNIRGLSVDNFLKRHYMTEHRIAAAEAKAQSDPKLADVWQAYARECDAQRAKARAWVAAKAEHHFSKRLATSLQAEWDAEIDRKRSQARVACKAWTDAGDALVAELEADAREYARRAAQAATTGVMGFDLETSEAHGFATTRRSDAQEAVATWTAAFDADVKSYDEQKRALASQVDGGAVLAVALTDEEVEFETKKRLLAAEIRARASKSMFAFAAHMLRLRARVRRKRLKKQASSTRSVDGGAADAAAAERASPQPSPTPDAPRGALGKPSFEPAALAPVAEPEPAGGGRTFARGRALKPASPRVAEPEPAGGGRTFSRGRALKPASPRAAEPEPAAQPAAPSGKTFSRGRALRVKQG